MRRRAVDSRVNRLFDRLYDPTNRVVPFRHSCGERGDLAHGPRGAGLPSHMGAHGGVPSGASLVRGGAQRFRRRGTNGRTEAPARPVGRAEHDRFTTIKTA